jgi:hypothetical protein
VEDLLFGLSLWTNALMVQDGNAGEVTKALRTSIQGRDGEPRSGDIYVAQCVSAGNARSRRKKGEPRSGDIGVARFEVLREKADPSLRTV